MLDDGSGVASLPIAEGGYPLERIFEAIERDLSIHTVDDTYVNRMNALVKQGADKLGWHAARVPVARAGCARSGFCMQGCSYNAKQSQLVTYIPRALRAGARQPLPGTAISPGRSSRPPWPSSSAG